MSQRSDVPARPAGRERHQDLPIIAVASGLRLLVVRLVGGFAQEVCLASGARHRKRVSGSAPSLGSTGWSLGRHSIGYVGPPSGTDAWRRGKAKERSIYADLHATQESVAEGTPAWGVTSGSRAEVAHMARLAGLGVSHTVYARSDNSSVAGVDLVAGDAASPAQNARVAPFFVAWASEALSPREVHAWCTAVSAATEVSDAALRQVLAHPLVILMWSRAQSDSLQPLMMSGRSLLRATAITAVELVRGRAPEITRGR